MSENTPTPTDTRDTADPEILRKDLADYKRAHAAAVRRKDLLENLLNMVFANSTDLFEDGLREWASGDAEKGLLLADVLDFYVEQDYTVALRVSGYITLTVTADTEDEAREKVDQMIDDLVTIDDNYNCDGVVCDDTSDVAVEVRSIACDYQ